MKYGIAALAALGVSAHHTHQHNVKVAIVDLVYKPYFGESVIETCPAAPERYNDGEFLRIMMKEAHKSSIIHTYSDVSEENYPVSEECFGDWMKDAWKPIHKVHHKVHDDFWTVSKEEWEAYGTAWIDMSYKNMEVCQIKKIGDDMISHCMAEEDACWNKLGKWKNALFNIIPMVTEIHETTQEFIAQPLCVSDDEIIAGIANRYGNWMDIMKMWSGLDINWVRSADFEKHTFKEYHAEKKAWKSVNHPFLEKIVPWMMREVSAIFQ